jgi:sulfonate transport system permease protein
LPSLLVGLRYSLSIAILMLVVAEQVNASAGLGYLVNNARDFMRTDIIVVCLLVYAALGLGADAGPRRRGPRAGLAPQSDRGSLILLFLKRRPSPWMLA